MKFKTYSVLSLACLLGTAAIAGEEHRTRIEIVVDEDASDRQTFLFDTQDAGFDLHSMAVGETRSLTDASGNVADVRRTDDGFEFDINGKTIDLKDLHEIDDVHGVHDIEMHIDDIDTDLVAVKGVRKVKMIQTDDDNSVTVISSGEIDMATRDRIREVLEFSGQDRDVLFIDGSEFDVDGDTHAQRKHEVHIIRKEVDVTN
jgi:hypothetical protein